MAAIPGVEKMIDADGIILDMNDRAVANYKKDGGAALMGKNVLDCHPEPARAKLAAFLGTQAGNARARRAPVLFLSVCDPEMQASTPRITPAPLSLSSF